MKIWITANHMIVYRLNCLRCNCYLVRANGSFFLVDTSVRGERAALTRSLDKLGVRSLRGVLLTHVHTDHAGNAAFLQEQFRCPVYVPPMELEMAVQGRCLTPRGTMPYTRLVEKTAERLHLWTSFEACPEAIPLPQSLSMVGEHGDMLTLLCSPGHTSGSCSYLIGGELALVGDLMTGGCVYPPFADDHDALKCSWKRLLETGCRLYLPGHGGAVTPAALQRTMQKRFGEQ